jgi:hypothetical protein
MPKLVCSVIVRASAASQLAASQFAVNQLLAANQPLVLVKLLLPLLAVAKLPLLAVAKPRCAAAPAVVKCVRLVVTAAACRPVVAKLPLLAVAVAKLPQLSKVLLLKPLPKLLAAIQPPKLV